MPERQRNKHRSAQHFNKNIMRLINTNTLEIQEFVDADHAPVYAILSHCWGVSELSFQDYSERGTRTGQGCRKIHKCCTLAKAEGWEWIWIDTCCIDKRSSAELSEAVNSMFKWYNLAGRCYVHLHDVNAASGDKETLQVELRCSRWFTRGWTLQELIAPQAVTVLNKNWEIVGKSPNRKYIESIRGHIDPNFDWIKQTMASITGIPQELIGYNEFGYLDHSTASRLSWMRTRQTTRSEDLGYCLLGLLGINMPLLYGEGEKAFYRLQLEILKQIGDESILAFNTDFDIRDSNSLFAITVDFFARGPAAFQGSGHIGFAITHDRPPIVITSRFAEINPASTRAGVYNLREDESRLLLRLNCCQHTNQGFSSPCILFLRSLACGHFIRVVAPYGHIRVQGSLETTCIEEDLSDATEWVPLASSSDQPMLVHLRTSDVGLCHVATFGHPNRDSETVKLRLPCKLGQSRPFWERCLSHIGIWKGSQYVSVTLKSIVSDQEGRDFEPSTQPSTDTLNCAECTHIIRARQRGYQQRVELS